MDFPQRYRAIREGTAIVERSGRGRLLVAGADRRSYLQGLLTNDITALSAGTGCYAAYLTAQGRMIADLRVFEMGDAILLDLEGFVAPTVRDRLAQFVFSEDVEIRDLTAAKAQVGVYGPGAAALLSSALAAAHALNAESAAGAASDAPPADLLEAMPMFGSARWSFHGSPVYVLRGDDLGVAGFDLVVDVERRDALIAALREQGAIDVDEEVVETTRIEAARPRFGIDMDDDTIPLEAGIEDRAISRTKGCYVGQEVIIRVIDRGHGRVARRLVGLKLAAGDLPARGETIRAGDRDIGRVTSAVQSPRLDAAIALGYVHRDFTAPGTAVRVGDAPAVVAATPFA
jgi:folate-binding protein YgfZ